jgi:hypothetical protein
MSRNNTSDSTVIPIQGTFDIAQGRNTIRSKVTLWRWPISFNARAATAMTALGELILFGNVSTVTPVHITFINSETECGIELRCTIPKSVSEADRWDVKADNLVRATDDLDVQESGNQIEIRAWVWL